MTKKIKKKDFIYNGDFCSLQTDVLEAEGYPFNSYVYVAGSRAFPTEEDIYNQRIMFMVHTLDHNKSVEISKIFLVDPKSLAKVNKATQKELYDKFVEDYDKDVTVEIDLDANDSTN